MIIIKPIKLVGNWDEGYALDLHTVSSEHIGDNEWGKPKFETNRSEIGELVYQLKYNNNLKVLDDLMVFVKKFLEEWTSIKNVNTILPIPPTKERIIQPVFKICEEISKYLNIDVYYDVLLNLNNVQMKDIDVNERKKFKHDIVLNRKAKNKKSILLVDDLYSSGTTAKLSTKVLKDNEYIEEVFLLTMTKTRK